jgi:non-specific serine/threonine protein kinase
LDAIIPVDENGIESPLIFKYENTFYLWQNAEDVLLTERFLNNGRMRVAEDDWNRQLAEFILPLTKKYDVQFSGIQKEELKNTLLKCG